MVDISKFKLPEIFNDAQGKSQAILLCGTLFCFIGAGGVFIAGTTILLMVVLKFEKDPNVLGFFQMLVMQSLALCTLGAAMLGVDRSVKDKKAESI